MAKVRKPPTRRDLEDALDEDILLGPIELAQDELRSAGLDPTAIAKRGAVLGQSFTWQIKARKQLAKSRELEVEPEEFPLDRDYLRAQIEQAQVRMAFRGRVPEEADADELVGILRDIRLLERLEDTDISDEDE